MSSKYKMGGYFDNVQELYEWAIDLKSVYFNDKVVNHCFVRNQQIEFLATHLKHFRKTIPLEIKTNRLTKQNTKIIPVAKYFPNVEKGKEHDDLIVGVMVRQIIDKLGEIEDIEDVLGLDIKTISKAINTGAFFNLGVIGIKYIKNVWLRTDSKFPELDFFDGDDFIKCKHFYLKDYGKTWALTKEELEK